MASTMRKMIRREFVSVLQVFYLCLFGIALFAVLLSARTHAGDKSKLAPIPAGKKADQEVDVGDKRLKLFTYKPKNYNKGPLLLVFHGADRNADDYRDAAIPLADRRGC